MRTFGSALFALIAVAAMVAALPSLWITLRVADDDGFASMAVSAGRDAKVRAAIADELAARISELSSGVVPASLISAGTEQYTASAQFPQDFADVVTQQHHFLFDEPTTPAARNGVLELDLTPMVNRVLRGAHLGGISVNGNIAVPLDTRASGLEAGRYHRPADQIRTIGYVSAAAGVAAILLALLLARRRAVVIVMLGLGAALSAGVSLALSLVAMNRARDEVSGARGSARTVADVLIEHAGADARMVALYAAAAGGVVFVLGLLGVVVGRRM